MAPRACGLRASSFTTLLRLHRSTTINVLTRASTCAGQCRVSAFLFIESKLAPWRPHCLGCRVREVASERARYRHTRFARQSKSPMSSSALSSLPLSPVSAWGTATARGCCAACDLSDCAACLACSALRLSCCTRDRHSLRANVSRTDREKQVACSSRGRTAARTATAHASHLPPPPARAGE